jgi:HAD superfamily hydrolase (TIGR01509 family)
MVKAILSDGGNILFSDRGTKRAEYEKINKHIPQLSYEEFYAGFRKFKTMAQTLPNYNLDDGLRDYLTEIGHAEIYEIIKNEKSEKKGGQMELIKNVKETLQKIHEAGVPFIILTDATKKGSELKPFLAKLGIEEYVTEMVSSKDVGVIKPDERFFATILEKYGLKKEEVVFIAHDDDELRGACNLGIPVIAFNYESTQDLSYIPEGQKIKDFSELETKILKK